MGESWLHRTFQANRQAMAEATTDPGAGRRKRTGSDSAWYQLRQFASFALGNHGVRT